VQVQLQSEQAGEPSTNKSGSSLGEPTTVAGAEGEGAELLEVDVPVAVVVVVVVVAAVVAVTESLPWVLVAAVVTTSTTGSVTSSVVVVVGMGW
jgi:hypothetical protein